MTEKDLTQKAKQTALENGANLVGVVRVDDLPEHHDRIERELPGSKRVLVTIAGHSLAALQEPYPVVEESIKKLCGDKIF